MKKLTTLVLLLFTINGFSEELQVGHKVLDTSDVINNASVELQVMGGVAPYLFKWSNQNTPLSSNQSSDLTEGSSVEVTITDNNGSSIIKTISIPAKSFPEKINGWFKPKVDWIGGILFWDPFAAVGIHDPVVYDNAGNPVLHPNGDPQQSNIPFIVVWLLFGALFFTIRMAFVNFRGFRHAIHLVRGKFDSPDDKGEVSHFQALTTALSATVGLGNIAGVAVAVAMGGAGATFWMILAGILGMSAKFVECTLGVKYRTIDEDGNVSGGPMYYLSKGLEKQNMKWLGKILAGAFAVLCIGASFGGGNMFQANQAFAQVSSEFTFLAGYGTWFGVVLALLVGVVIIGGIKSIAKVTDKIVPFMCGLYVLFAIIIIGMNFGNIGEAFWLIIDGAFSPDALKGGFIGVLIIGFQRAAFSNEAGVGSASIAHSASKTNEPVSEGIVALLEPFIDTVVVCTMTALVLIFTGYAEDPQGLIGVELTSAAFSQVFGWFNYVLVIAIVLFAFSTMISWSYYGMKGWAYLFGNSKTVENSYKVLFLIFVIIGASSELGAVLDFSDMMILAMAFPNIVGLIILSKEVRLDLRSYFKRVASGEIKQYK